jgi:phosphoribosyl 1,2-cyclic phosphodiesterase
MPTQTNASSGKTDAASDQPDASAESSARMLIRFWGVRGSIPMPGPTTIEYGGNTSCLEVRAGKQIIILDAGTGLRLLGRKLLAEFRERPLDLTLLLTHTHWDHIQGLPFFLPMYQPQNRLRILGYEGARRGLEAVLASQMESPVFPIGLREVPANVQIEECQQMHFNLGEVEVAAFKAYHPGMCVGYRLSFNGSSLAFFPDNELPCKIGSVPGQTSIIREHLARMNSGELSAFVRGTDVLIMDTQYDREEYSRHIGWGHGCVDEVVDLALKSQVKQLFLFHHDPDHDDAKISAMVAQARTLVAERNGALHIEAAREGGVVQTSKMLKS